MSHFVRLVLPASGEPATPESNRGVARPCPNVYQAWHHTSSVRMGGRVSWSRNQQPPTCRLSESNHALASTAPASAQAGRPGRASGRCQNTTRSMRPPHQRQFATAVSEGYGSTFVTFQFTHSRARRSSSVKDISDFGVLVVVLAKDACPVRAPCDSLGIRAAPADPLL